MCLLYGAIGPEMARLNTEDSITIFMIAQEEKFNQPPQKGNQTPGMRHSVPCFTGQRQKKQRLNGTAVLRMRVWFTGTLRFFILVRVCSTQPSLGIMLTTGVQEMRGPYALPLPASGASVQVFISSFASCFCG